MSSTFERERDDILIHVKAAISRILLGEDRTSKHLPYTWLHEDIESHLLKATRHINTHIQIKKGYQKDTSENHLDNAICRLAMAVAKIGGNEAGALRPENGENILKVS